MSVTELKKLIVYLVVCLVLHSHIRIPQDSNNRFVKPLKNTSVTALWPKQVP